jgi:hypothetical protein
MSFVPSIGGLSLGSFQYSQIAFQLYGRIRFHIHQASLRDGLRRQSAQRITRRDRATMDNKFIPTTVLCPCTIVAAAAAAAAAVAVLRPHHCWENYAIF